MKDIERFFCNPMKEKPATKKQVNAGLKKIIASNKAFKAGKKQQFKIEV